ncbi:MAG: Hpt domain-containing protein [Clostridia bacterium]|nr:Hpt domain-containing protein [Clostridia bacterium]
MLSINALKEFGANVEEGLARCLNDEDFYLKLVKKAADSTDFDLLKTAVEQKDYKTAFETAHSIKGVFGNLSVTPIYEPTAQITELLRADTDTDYTELLGSIIKNGNKLKELCK